MGMECPCCHNDMSSDYFLFDIHRIKDGVPLFTNPIMMCLRCYTELIRSQRIINDKEVE